jgi:2,3-bisphosphoglycerate-dependent phosphoglycerate mutase
MSRLILIRHCRSTAQHLEAPLTEAGASEARELGKRLAPLGIDAIYSSPYARAVATIEPLARHSGLSINIEPRLRERLLAPHSVDDFIAHIQRSFDDPGHRLPGGESLSDTAERALEALGEIALKSHVLPVAVGHGNLIASVLRSVDSGFGYHDWAALRNPDLFMLDFEGAVLVSYQPLTIAP